jgi:hypothetical protein
MHNPRSQNRGACWGYLRIGVSLCHGGRFCTWSWVPKVSKQSQGCNLVIIMQDHALALTRHILVIGMASPVNEPQSLGKLGLSGQRLLPLDDLDGLRLAVQPRLAPQVPPRLGCCPHPSKLGPNPARSTQPKFPKTWNSPRQGRLARGTYSIHGIQRGVAEARGLNITERLQYSDQIPWPRAQRLAPDSITRLP